MAPPDSNQFSADVRDLYTAGGRVLPELATVFATASGDVAGTGDGIIDVFKRPDYFGGDLGQVYVSWQILSDELQGILADTSKNLELAGKALCLAADVYAASDHEAEEELKRLRKRYPPPHVPEPKYPSIF